MRQILDDVRHLSRPLWGGDRKRTAYLWTAATIFLAFAATSYAVFISTIQRLFWNTMAAKDVLKFRKVLFLYFIAVILGPLVLSTFAWVKERLALMWRRALTDFFLTRYFSSCSYYNLSLSSSIDNPDQRISEDVTNFTSRAVSFITTIGVAFFDLIIFSVLLHRIYAPLLYTLLVYSIGGTALIAVVGRNLLQLNRQQISRFADFRFGLVRVRETTESIAFYGGEEAEKAHLLSRFTAAFENNIRLIGMQRNVKFVSSAFTYFAQIIPTVVIAPRYFSGAVQMGVISQVFFSFNHVLSSLGLAVSEYQALAEFGAGVRRLSSLSAALSDGEHNTYVASEIDTAVATQPPDGGNGSAHHIVTEILGEDALPSVEVEALTVLTPGVASSTQPLVQDLSVRVAPGKRLLVVGRSGIGKSSLLRVLCGLWGRGSGLIRRPSVMRALFLPQRPFVMLGSLRENVIYPSRRFDVLDDEVVAALRKVNLAHLPAVEGGLDVPGEELSRRLSLGEQQRLAFARVLIARPDFVVLDESTSALDLENERTMYQIIDELNVTCVSVGNRPSLLAFHDEVLRLEAGGEWSLMSPEVAKVVPDESVRA